MTVTKMIELCRGLSRTNVTACSNTAVVDWLNEAQRQFVKETGGMVGEEYLQLSAKFDTRTFFAVRLSSDLTAALDIQVTSTERTDTTGTQVASDLEAQIQAETGDTDWSVSYNSDRKFEITQVGASTITVESPDGFYVDACPLLFGGSVTSTSGTLAGGSPEGMYLEADLPDDFQEVLALSWDHKPLDKIRFEAIQRNATTGTPTHYAIRESRVRFFPVPTEPANIHLWYKKFPDDLSVDTLDGTSTVPADYHMTLVYFAGSKMADENFEYDTAKRLYGYFKDSVNRYRRERANENPKRFTYGPNVFASWEREMRRYLT